MRCPNCGRVNDDDNMFCVFCGAPLAQAQMSGDGSSSIERSNEQAHRQPVPTTSVVAVPSSPVPSRKPSTSSPDPVIVTLQSDSVSVKREPRMPGYILLGVVLAVSSFLAMCTDPLGVFGLIAVGALLINGLIYRNKSNALSARGYDWIRCAGIGDLILGLSGPVLFLSIVVLKSSGVGFLIAMIFVVFAIYGYLRAYASVSEELFKSLATLFLIAAIPLPILVILFIVMFLGLIPSAIGFLMILPFVSFLLRGLGIAVFSKRSLFER